MARAAAAWSLCLLACASPPGVAPTTPGAAADEPPPARLTLAGDEVVAVATPTDLRGLPLAARTTVEAIAPEGELLFCGRERGPRGPGYRVEKRYEEPVPHVRSVLVDADGAVLERGHTLPLPDVPHHVLAAALTVAPFVESAEIVSGPTDEEFWRLVVRDRREHTFLVTVGLSGRTLSVHRRSAARVDS